MDRDALPTATLGDGHVTLREWAEADAPALETVCGDPAVCRFTTVPWEYREAAARDWVARQRQKRREGRVVAFAITLDGDDRALGTTVLSSFDWESRTRSSATGLSRLPGAGA